MPRHRAPGGRDAGVKLPASCGTSEPSGAFSGTGSERGADKIIVVFAGAGGVTSVLTASVNPA